MKGQSLRGDSRAAWSSTSWLSVNYLTTNDVGNLLNAQVFADQWSSNCSSPGHPVRVMTRVWEAQPEEPGTVLVKQGSPVRLHAVVHDLDADPSWKEMWVRAALSGIFEEAARHRLRSLKLPLLATKHGSLPANRFMVLLREALMEPAASLQQHLQGIWLVRDGESGAELLATLTASEPEQAQRRHRAPSGSG